MDCNCKQNRGSGSRVKMAPPPCMNTDCCSPPTTIPPAMPAMPTMPITTLPASARSAGDMAMPYQMAPAANLRPCPCMNPSPAGNTMPSSNNYQTINTMPARNAYMDMNTTPSTPRYPMMNTTPPIGIVPPTGMMPPVGITPPIGYPNPGTSMNQFPIGMAYVPMQQWSQTYSMEQGIDRGTIFPDLDLPFTRGGC